LVDAAYLQAFLQSLYSDPTQETLRRGVLGQWSITRSDLEDLEIELPPLAEQKRISAAFSAMHEARRAAQAVSDHYGFLLENLCSQYFRSKP
jgi:restriction endonuclease S subunit